MGGIVKPEEFDCASSLWPFFPPRGRPKLTCTFPFRLGLDTDFHELVITQEIVLCGARGYGDGLGGGNVIGLPPVLNFASPELKAKVVPEVFSGKKKICLAISEAFAGSDVSNLRCEAKKSEDGKEWIVSFLALCLSLPSTTNLTCFFHSLRCRDTRSGLLEERSPTILPFVSTALTYSPSVLRKADK